MEAAGIEPATKFIAPTDSLTTYVAAPYVCAANALHPCSSGCRCLSEIDSDLQMVVAVWNRLPQFVRTTILALIARPAGQSVCVTGQGTFRRSSDFSLTSDLARTGDDFNYSGAADWAAPIFLSMLQSCAGERGSHSRNSSPNWLGNRRSTGCRSATQE
jgi:hypothetical protein